MTDWARLSGEQRDMLEELLVRTHVMPGPEAERAAWTTVTSREDRVPAAPSDQASDVVEVEIEGPGIARRAPAAARI